MLCYNAKMLMKECSSEEVKKRYNAEKGANYRESRRDTIPYRPGYYP